MKKNNRIVVVDALRGFALLGIVLIHFVEHFDFFYPADHPFFFSPETDQKVIDVVMFLVSGKAYSIFALTFGFSFFIQINRKEKQGFDFRGKYAWRLTILFFMGLIHSLVYRGDILHIYALLGFPLLLMYKLKTRTLWLIAILLIIQIPILIPLARSFLNPDYVYKPDWGRTWFNDGEAIYAKGSFWDVVKFNVWKSRYLVYAWTFYTGRAVQLFALFIIGLILGRKGYFENLSANKSKIIKLLALTLVSIALLALISTLIGNSGISDQQKGLLGTLIKTFSNLAYNAGIVSVFMLVYLAFQNSGVFNSLAVYGKMSLTNYVSQAVFGVIVFFGFGFGLYSYLGATWSLLFGACFFILQVYLSKLWIGRYYYGPLEWVWRALTNLDFSIKFKRN